MHVVSVLALDGVLAFDLATPCEVFARVRVPGKERPYRVQICGQHPEVRTRDFGIRPPYGLDAMATADTIVVPGIEDPRVPAPEAVLEALRSAAARGVRLASICTGAFTLAAAGLLDGLPATTHWLAADLLAERYPSVRVDPNVLYVDNGQVLTSAGATAGVDLCLHLVRLDYGAAVAADAARLSVTALERDGGQSQFILHEPPGTSKSLADVLEWMAQSIGHDLSLAAIAKRAGVSTRTLNRHFKAQTGTTPLQWVLRYRVRRAQDLLETSTLSIEEVASAVGFESAPALRERFRHVVGASPSAYRRRFSRRKFDEDRLEPA